ncbi:MBL fold metallo-hydrolase [Clostridium hydrogenum]|uniref:hypothetical protein n=1 Tax=Clostridium hydrogenum TaxID=2855764 RepID=UPI001F381609|nr:hypothetical protein [Clostridium hydrogenum]
MIHTRQVYNFSSYSYDPNVEETLNKNGFLKSSSAITAKLIYSGELKTHLSTAINLKHPACSGLKDKEVSVPGHTKGHTSYLVNAKEHPILIAGDACCISLSMEKGVGPSGSDVTLVQRSFERIMQFLKNNPEVKV